ncbi:hypothetical protein OROHE_023106 [Orobanche hederae]
MEDLKEIKKRGREESDSVGFDESDSPVVKRLRENLLDVLDDDEVEFCTAIQDLDSFMKSFEDEITASSSPASGGDGDPDVVEVVGLTSDCSESRLDLGYLLEASDDELGIPPTSSSPVGLGSEMGSDLVRSESDSSELGGVLFDIPSCETFGFGFGETEGNNNDSNCEYVALDGFFDYTDLGFLSGSFAYRPETLPAQ